MEMDWSGHIPTILCRGLRSSSYKDRPRVMILISVSLFRAFTSMFHDLCS
jgi:hypothetical protein